MSWGRGTQRQAEGVLVTKRTLRHTDERSESEGLSTVTGGRVVTARRARRGGRQSAGTEKGTTRPPGQGHACSLRTGGSEQEASPERV